MKKKLSRLNWLLLLSLLALALPGSTRAGTPLSAENFLEIRAAVQVALDASEHLYAIVFDVEIDQITYYSDWAIVGLNLYEKGTHELVPTEPGIALAWRIGMDWAVALPDDAVWGTQVAAAPEQLLPQSMKELLLVSSNETELNQLQAYGGYYLPWPQGVTHRLTRSISHGCPGTTCYAFDFADANDQLFEITAARNGTVKYAVWTYPNGYWDGDANHANYIVIQNDIGLYDVYLHLAYDSIPSHLRTSGSVVHRGEKVGNADDTGHSTGHHLHFHAHANAASWYGTAVDITFDDVSVCGGRPRLPAEDSCATTNYYTSGNPRPDSTPPTSSVSLSGTPGENGWYVSAVQVTLSASDNSGGSGVKTLQCNIDNGGWQTYIDPFTLSGAGAHTVEYKAQDNAGNWETPQSVTFNIDAAAPNNPTSVAPGCAATHNVWQNACADPAFTWSGASDGASGVAGYQRYWGTDPNGVSDAWTTSTTFDPGAVGAGAMYLRVRTKDNAGNWSGWTTLFAFRYDATAPTGSLALNNGDTVTYATLVRLTTTSTDAHSSVGDVRFRDVNGAWSDWQLYSPNLYWQLPGLTGQTLGVEVQYRDRAGNTSSVYRDTIALNLYPARPASTNYRLARSTFGASGATRTSPNYQVWSTLGQPAPIGVMQSIGYRMVSGYWARLEAAQYAIYLPLVIRQ